MIVWIFIINIIINTNNVMLTCGMYEYDISHIII